MTTVLRLPTYCNVPGLVSLTIVLVGVVVVGSWTEAGGTARVNLALNKPTAQKDSYGTNYVPSKANDGTYYTEDHSIEPGQSCTSTFSTTQTWWMLDLQEDVHITTIGIQTRKNYESRLTNFYVYVSKTTPTSIPGADNSFVGELCLHYPGSLPFTPESVKELSCSTLGGVLGRYIYVYKPANHSLTICEFEVYPSGEAWKTISMQNIITGQKSSVTPLHREVLDRICIQTCVAACMSAMNGAAPTQVQLNTRKGLCECLVIYGPLDLSPDEGYELWKVYGVYRG